MIVLGRLLKELTFSFSVGENPFWSSELLLIDLVIMLSQSAGMINKCSPDDKFLAKRNTREGAGRWLLGGGEGFWMVGISTSDVN